MSLEDTLLQAGVRRDAVDLRDAFYEPTLRVLSGEMQPGPQGHFDALFNPTHGGAVRHQGSLGRCTGHALAALVDLQRRDQLPGRIPGDQRVSADMLYWMGRFHDELDAGALVSGAPGKGLRSLRSVIKGFYHHGVCLETPCQDLPVDATWPSLCAGQEEIEDRNLTVVRAKAARNISLGAYYRLRPVLNDYHAALSEVGAVLVSANVHRGWLGLTGGEIRWPDADGPVGTHAFVVVGYTDRGFLVLNSWGADWGGYGGRPGLALWHYADWAKNVVDGWVLRLGVSTPAAFDVSIGEQGLSKVYGPVQTGSTPNFELLGHYMHLNDGFHVDYGARHSSADSWKKTFTYLQSELERDTEPEGPAPYHGLVLWFPGSFEGIKPAFAKAAARKNRFRALGLYPYTVFWCNELSDDSLSVLTVLFDHCRKQAGDDPKALARVIETQMRGIGRAIWRDIEQGARRAVWGTSDLPQDVGRTAETAEWARVGHRQIEALHRGGPDSQIDEIGGMRRIRTPGHLVDFAEGLARLLDGGMELHLVTEGAGILVLHELLIYDAAHGRRLGLAERISSLNLSLPAVGLPRARTEVLPLVARLTEAHAEARDIPQPDDGEPVPPPRARIFVPSEGLEERLVFGDYKRSLYTLISHAFEDRLADGNGARGTDPDEHPNHPRHPPRPILGTHGGAEGAIATGEVPAAAFSRIQGLSAPDRTFGEVSHQMLADDSALFEEILTTIRAHSQPPGKKNVTRTRIRQGGG